MARLGEQLVFPALLALLSLVPSPRVLAQDAVEPMPLLGRATAEAELLARRCGGTDAAACTTLADLQLRAGNGSAANALYRRAADLARVATTATSITPGVTTVRSVADALRTLEHAWSTVVVTAAGAHGLAALARDAAAQVFGAGAVAAWTGRRARRADAFRAAYTMRTREAGAFAELVWIGDEAALATPGDVWQLRFAYMNLDFEAYVDDAGNVVALVHVPEG